MKFVNVLEFDESWMEKGNCISENPDIFFPQDKETEKMAKNICAQCVVREECLNFAIKNNEKFAIWGGKNRNERVWIGLGRSLKQLVGRAIGKAA